MIGKTYKECTELPMFWPFCAFFVSKCYLYIFTNQNYELKLAI